MRLRYSAVHTVPLGIISREKSGIKKQASVLHARIRARLAVNRDGISRESPAHSSPLLVPLFFPPSLVSILVHTKCRQPQNRTPKHTPNPSRAA